MFQPLNRPLAKEELGPLDDGGSGLRMYPMNHPVNVHIVTNEGWLTNGQISKTALPISYSWAILNEKIEIRLRQVSSCTN